MSEKVFKEFTVNNSKVRTSYVIAKIIAEYEKPIENNENYLRIQKSNL